MKYDGKYTLLYPLSSAKEVRGTVIGLRKHLTSEQYIFIMSDGGTAQHLALSNLGTLEVSQPGGGG